jgi:hypothetical protein
VFAVNRLGTNAHHHVAQDVAVGKAEQSQIVNLPAAEDLHPKGHARFKAKRSDIRPETITNIPLPDAFRLAGHCVVQPAC